MCDPITALVVTSVLTTGVQLAEGKKAEKRANRRNDKLRIEQEEKEANIISAAREADTAKGLQSAQGTEAERREKRKLGKRALRAPTALGGIQRTATLGGIGAATGAPQAKRPTALGGI